MRARVHILILMLLQTNSALRAPTRAWSRNGVAVSSFGGMPGASRERIPEDVARSRSGWPHWSDGKAKKADDASAKKTDAPAPAPARAPARAPPGAAAPAPRAYTLALYQERCAAAARRDALLGVAEASGALCGAARGDDAAPVDAEIGAVLRALAEYASERGTSLDACAAASLPGGGGAPA